MDTIVVALSVAIAVVLLILLSCWDYRRRKNEYSCASVQMNIHPAKAPDAGVGAPLSRSQYGSGVANQAFRERSNALKEVVEYEDYKSVAEAMAIEEGVYRSHADFTEDMSRTTTGASLQTVRDDPNDLNPWVAGFKPRYHDVYVTPGARTEHSEIPDQMRRTSFYMLR